MIRSAYGLPLQWKPGDKCLTVIVLTNLDRGPVDALIAGISVRYAPELLPHAARQFPDRATLGLK